MSTPVDNHSKEPTDVRNESSLPPADAVAVTLPKAGNDASENEDAFVVRDTSFPVRAVVADGATEAVYSGLWADVLTQHVATLDDWSDVDWADAMQAARSEWQAVVNNESADVPWYVAEKREQGAFATVLGLMIRRDGTFIARAVGDCLLIHQSHGSRSAWPIDDPGAFTNRPALLSTRSEANPVPADSTDGTWKEGDIFLLATDAVAAWLLRKMPDLAQKPENLHEQLREAREAGQIHNDDCTLVRIEMISR